MPAKYTTAAALRAKAKVPETNITVEGLGTFHAHGLNITAAAPLNDLLQGTSWSNRSAPEQAPAFGAVMAACIDKPQMSADDWAGLYLSAPLDTFKLLSDLFRALLDFVGFSGAEATRAGFPGGDVVPGAEPGNGGGGQRPEAVPTLREVPLSEPGSMA